jgi:hypothetical protein
MQSFTSVLCCLQELCVGPALRTLDLNGEVPFVSLLSYCGPSVKELYGSFLCGEPALKDLLPQGRSVSIEIHALRMHSNTTQPIGMVDFAHYVVNPRRLFSFSSLRQLEISNYHSLY